MKYKIKDFINKNKGLIIGTTCMVIGGVLGYTIKKEKVEVIDSGIKNVLLPDEPPFPILDTLDEAIDQFKEYQETNKSIAIFWENDKYAVMDLEKK